MAADVVNTWREGRRVEMGTDGGSKCETGTWSVVMHRASGLLRGPVPGEDFSSVQSELHALWVVLHVLAMAIDGANEAGIVRRKVRVHVDCKPALMFHENNTRPPLERLCLWEDVQRLRARLRQERVQLTLRWVPSHGKTVRHWRAVPLARALNDSADHHCTVALQEIQRSDRDLRFKTAALTAKARAWSKKALQYAVERVQSWRIRLGAGDGESVASRHRAWLAESERREQAHPEFELLH